MELMLSVLWWNGQVIFKEFRWRRSPKKYHLTTCLKSTILREKNMESSSLNTFWTLIASFEKHITPRFEDRQHFYFWRNIQDRWYECFQSTDLAKTISLHSNRYSILCQSWNMERWTLWYKIWYMVIWLYNLWDVYSSSSFLSKRYWKPIQENKKRKVWKNTRSIFLRTC